VVHSPKASAHFHPPSLAPPEQVVAATLAAHRAVPAVCMLGAELCSIRPAVEGYWASALCAAEEHTAELRCALRLQRAHSAARRLAHAHNRRALAACLAQLAAGGSARASAAAPPLLLLCADHRAEAAGAPTSRHTSRAPSRLAHASGAMKHGREGGDASAVGSTGGSGRPSRPASGCSRLESDGGRGGAGAGAGGRGGAFLEGLGELKPAVKEPLSKRLAPLWLPAEALETDAVAQLTANPNSNPNLTLTLTLTLTLSLTRSHSLLLS
jgi:hypothetical protein